MQGLDPAGKRSAEDDEPVIDERVHELRMLVPAVLLAHIAREVPGASTLETNREKHSPNLTTA